MPGLWCELFLRCRGCGGRGLWVLIPIFSPPPSGFFLQGFEGCRRRTLLWGGVHWSNPWVHWSNPLLSGSTPGVWGISPNFGPRTCCRALRARSSLLHLLTTHGIKLHECCDSMGLVARAWCKKRTFHLGKCDTKKATTLSHLRILGGGRGYTAAGCEPAA